LVSRRILAVTILAIIIVSGVAGYAGYNIGYQQGFKAGYAEAPVPVRIGHLIGDIHQIHFFIADSKSWYQEEGIEPIGLEYASGPVEMMAFAAGDLDAGYVGVVPFLTAKSKGLDAVIVASANLEGSAIVAKPEIAKVEDLNNKRVGTPGIGTIQDSLLYMVERKFNISVVRYHMTVSELPLALQKAEIDAYIAWEPFPAEAVVRGLGHVVYTSYDIYPNHQCCVLYVSGKMFRERPDIVEKLIGIHIRAAKLCMEHPEEAQQIFADRAGKSIEVVTESWKRMVWDYHVNTESMKVFVEYLIEQGKVMPADVPDVGKFVTAAVDTTLLAKVESEA
jgi:NitT/TauT family transport system substrate-binding protein